MLIVFISKFKIEKNPINEPAFDLKIEANMFNINWDMEIYGYINDKNEKLTNQIALSDYGVTCF